MDMGASLGTIERRTMHATVVHPVPRRADVVREQLAAVGLSLRREAAVVGALMALVSALILWREVTRGHEWVELAPEILVPAILVAFLAPMAVWKGEGPDRRGYHLAMPVERGFHAMVRSAAGLAWVLAAMAAYVAWLSLLMLMTDGNVRSVAWMQWVGPVAAAVVLYCLGSAVTLWSAHPWRWFGGGAVAYAFLSTLGEPEWGGATLLDAPAALLNGRYGFFTVASGLTPVRVAETLTRGDAVVGHYTRISHVALAGSWAMATWLWVAAAVALFAWAAHRQPER